MASFLGLLGLSRIFFFFLSSMLNQEDINQAQDELLQARIMKLDKKKIIDRPVPLCDSEKQRCSLKRSQILNSLFRS